LIGDINPPGELMMTLTDRKIAEEQQKTYEVQQAAQTQRQQLVRETAKADIQQAVVQAEQSVNIAELHSNAAIKQATGESEAIRLRATGEGEAIRLKALGEAEGVRAIGSAKADAYRAGVTALGPQGYTAIQLMQIIGDQNVRIIPDITVSGNGAGNSSLAEAMLGMLLRGQLNGKGTEGDKQ
jgi:uncharacterized membrane protein YqiK